MRHDLFLFVLTVLLVVAYSGGARAEHLLTPGQIVFIKECSKCHQVGANARNRIGPVLNGLFGRQAGTVEGFGRYSEAMRKSGIIWTPETFRAYISNPQSMIEGTQSVYRGLKDDESITQLIAYLQTK